MDSDYNLEDLVRVGTVSAVDSTKRRARVMFDDMGIVSGGLYVLRHGEDWMPKVDDRVLVLYLPVWGGDGFIIGVI